MGQESVEMMFEIIKNQNDKIDSMQKDVHKISVDIAIMKERSGLGPTRKEKATVAAAGGGLGVFFVAIMNFILEHMGKGN